ncbi:MAG: hypothetical protein R3B70_43340 [Polyangiaceae bacterium]
MWRLSIRISYRRAAATRFGARAFVFLPKGREHPEGILYCRAFERLLATLGRRSWWLEFYPDEGEYPLWELAFGRCEASWLDLPHSESGIAVTAWKSPATCRSLWSAADRAVASESYNPRYSLRRRSRRRRALPEGAVSGHGIFAIFQG